MNKTERKELKAITADLSGLLDTLQEISEEISNSRENIEEHFSNSPIAEKLEAEEDLLVAAVQGIEDALEMIEEAVEV